MFVMREHGRAALAGEAHRGERVGRLARLRDADHEVAGADDRVAVAVLGGDVHLDRHARPLLDRVAADQAGVVRGAAGDDDDPPHVAQERVVDRAEVAEVDAVAARRAVGDRLRDRVGLLVDLLEHERLVAALLGGLRVPVDLDDLALDRRRRRRSRTRRPSGRSTTISPSSMYCTLRVLAQERRDRGGEEVLALAAADDSGHSLRAPTSTPGSSALIATNAKWPRSSA